VTQTHQLEFRSFSAADTNALRLLRNHFTATDDPLEVWQQRDSSVLIDQSEIRCEARGELSVAFFKTSLS